MIDEMTEQERAVAEQIQHLIEQVQPRKAFRTYLYAVYASLDMRKTRGRRRVWRRIAAQRLGRDL